MLLISSVMDLAAVKIEFRTDPKMDLSIGPDAVMHSTGLGHRAW